MDRCAPNAPCCGGQCCNSNECLQCVNNECVNKCKAGETCCNGNCCPANYICCDGNCCPPGQVCSGISDEFGVIRRICKIPCGSSTCFTNEICCNGTCKTAGTVSQPEFRAWYQDPVFGTFSWVECNFIGDPPEGFYSNCTLWCGGEGWDITYGECVNTYGGRCRCCNRDGDINAITYTSPCDCAS